MFFNIRNQFEKKLTLNSSLKVKNKKNQKMFKHSDFQHPNPNLSLNVSGLYSKYSQEFICIHKGTK